MPPVRVEAETGVQGLLGKVTIEKRENWPEEKKYTQQLKIIVTNDWNEVREYSTLTLFPSDLALSEVASTMMLLDTIAEKGGEEESRDQTKEGMNHHSLDV